jgi:hypothetical protein
MQAGIFGETKEASHIFLVTSKNPAKRPGAVR